MKITNGKDIYTANIEISINDLNLIRQLLQKIYNKDLEEHNGIFAVTDGGKLSHEIINRIDKFSETKYKRLNQLKEQCKEETKRNNG